MKNKKRNKKSIFFSVLVIPIFFSGIFASISPCKETQANPITLEFWSVYDDTSVYRDLILAFQKDYPYITVNYHKKNYATYEQELVDALAAGRGPDIFSIHNTWLPKHQDKLYSAPQAMITPERFQELFVDVATADFVAEQKTSDDKIIKSVYALPFSVDTLALFYNRDLLNNAGVATPPKTWTEFNAAVEKIVKRDVENNIQLAGASIGTAKNINRSTDILSLLMLQNGTKMVADDKKSTTFNQTSGSGSYGFIPGENALLFYTSFANPDKKVYTWNQGQHYSVDAFVEGNAAMTLNYSYQISLLRARAPHLDFGVALAPQITADQPAISYANYWGQTVAKNSKNPEAAWQFLAWMVNPENMKKYLELAVKPASRRDLIEWQKTSNPDLAIFDQQALTAKSWYQVDNIALENIFAQMIESVVSRQATTREALDKANKQVSLLMEK